MDNVEVVSVKMLGVDKEFLSFLFGEKDFVNNKNNVIKVLFMWKFVM